MDVVIHETGEVLSLLERSGREGKVGVVREERDVFKRKVEVMIKIVKMGIKSKIESERFAMENDRLGGCKVTALPSPIPSYLPSPLPSPYGVLRLFHFKLNSMTVFKFKGQVFFEQRA